MKFCFLSIIYLKVYDCFVDLEHDSYRQRTIISEFFFRFMDRGMREHVVLILAVLKDKGSSAHVMS